MNPTPNFSVIVCSIDAGKFAQVSAAYRRLLAGHRCEIIGIHDAASLAEGYNRGIRQASGDILIFSHDDILILDPDFAAKVVQRLTHFDLLGFAGASKLVSDLWAGADLPFLHGVIAHAPAQSRQLTIDVFGALQWPVAGKIKAIDGLCMIARAEVARQVGFDAVTFDGFHLNDLDFSFAAYRAGFRIGVCCDIPVIHYSQGKFDSRHQHYADRFLEKHGPYLDSQDFARPPGHTWTTAAFADDQALLRTWQENTLKRSSIAIFRKAGLPLPPANSPLSKAPPAILARDEATEEARGVAPAPLQEGPPDEAYRKWLAGRIVPVDLQQLLPRTGTVTWPGFQFLLRLPAGAQGHLANTLDSLGQQYLESWRLDIITPLPAPDGLAELPNIGWHEVAAGQPVDMTSLVEAAAADWVLELPPGARLDPLYLWRIATEAARSPAIQAFFVDDDSTDPTGQRQAPRFKLGSNPGLLQSADLAGPLCLRQDAWQAIGGATQRDGSPWFSQLLRVANKFGWETIQHIPDILISYPDTFPSDTESCMFALVDALQAQDISADIVPATPRSWCIRHSLKGAPSISIAILSTGQLDLLSRCFNSVVEKTEYPNYEIIISLSDRLGAPDLDNWLSDLNELSAPSVRVIRTEFAGNYATRCNAAAHASGCEFMLFLREETVVIQEKWLEELARAVTQPGIGAVSPRMIQPGSATIENAGSVLGLNGIVGAAYQGKTKLGEDFGYLDCIHVARDVSTLPAACMLIRRESYLKAGGMDEADLGNHLAEVDLCLKIRRNGERLIYQPLSNIVSSNPTEAVFDLDPNHVATNMLAETHAKRAFFERWYPEAAVDPFWNRCLSLATTIPAPETEFNARWQTIPSKLPRILAHALPNGQGDYRVTSPLKAIANAGLASECIWRQRISGEARFNSIAELLRLNPDSVIVQHYTITPALAALQDWDSSGCRPFTVYAMDDLLTNMDAANPFRKDIAANARARLQYALKRCDRLVVSTDYLAEAYRGFIPDIRVVPNRLEQASWLPLRSLRRTSSKPRIGWAGGTTHQGDLLLLKEIIEQTREEADWIFFGMCPSEIRPLLAEYHDQVNFWEYPAYLASLNLDIAVAPLAETPFNRGKSNLRLLDYGVLGIPIICTDIEPYRNSPACRVKNTVADWTEAIRARIHDPEAREREGDAIRRWVLDGYLLENHLEEWLSAHLPG